MKVYLRTEGEVAGARLFVGNGVMVAGGINPAPTSGATMSPDPVEVPRMEEEVERDGFRVEPGMTVVVGVLRTVGMGVGVLATVGVGVLTGVGVGVLVGFRVRVGSGVGVGVEISVMVGVGVSVGSGVGARR